MVDLGSYVAEFCLIVSIVTLAHGTAIDMQTAAPSLASPVAIVLYVFMAQYSVVLHFPGIKRSSGIKRSFSFMYWKYCMLSIIVVENEYGTENIDSLDKVSKACLFIAFELLMFVAYKRILSYGQEQEGPLLRDGLDMIVYFFDNGMGIIGTCFISMNSICALLISVLSGLVVLSLVDTFPPEFSLIGLSYSLQRCQRWDLSMYIPLPFDVICFCLCNYLVKFTGFKESYAGAAPLERWCWAFSVVYIHTIFFMFYHFLEIEHDLHVLKNTA